MPHPNSYPRLASALLAAATLALLAAPAAQAQPRGYGHRHGPIVRCESNDGRYNECRTPFHGPAMLVEQLSSSRCIPGRTYGTTRRGRIWVNNGCRGDFAPRRWR